MDDILREKNLIRIKEYEQMIENARNKLDELHQAVVTQDEINYDKKVKDANDKIKRWIHINDERKFNWAEQLTFARDNGSWGRRWYLIGFNHIHRELRLVEFHVGQSLEQSTEFFISNAVLAKQLIAELPDELMLRFGAHKSLVEVDIHE